ncbi:MAG TPA: hypothetical protein VES89_11340 [Candidatus Competibacteraceae bacterium]|nr:hypothetical protein [Candidatus Competibacteraceae bacterium]
MDTANRAATERRAYWQEHLTQWHASGLTQVAYCHQHGLNRDQFGYWKKRLLSTRSPGTAPGGADFIAVQWAAVGAPLAVVLDEHLRVEVRPGFDPATLRAIVQALSSDVAA